MRIDVHAHYWTEDYLDLLAGLGRDDTGVARGLGAGDGAELDARLRLMDRAGVQLQVLSACPQEPYVEDAEKPPCPCRTCRSRSPSCAGPWTS
jgi:6-methylsalicylate decarboxylase